MQSTNDSSSTLLAYWQDASELLLFGEFIGTPGWKWLGSLGLVMAGGRARAS